MSRQILMAYLALRRRIPAQLRLQRLRFVDWPRRPPYTLSRCRAISRLMPANGPRLLRWSRRAIYCRLTIRRGGLLRQYELVVVMNPDIPEEDVPAAIDRVTSTVTNRGGEIEEVVPWGRRKLAYPIARQIEGNYVLTHIRLEPTRAREVESSLMLSEDVLRHLLVRKDEE
jgi:small subunit ribosomal protein S6